MRKKSKYKPKGVRVDALNWVVSGMKPIAQVGDALVTLNAKNYAALDEIKNGRSTSDHVDVIIAAVNMAEAFARKGVGSDWIDEIRQAQDAVYTMAKRGLSKGRFLFTGPEMKAVSLAIDVHAAQLEASSVKDMEDCLKIVEDEIRHKRARRIQ